MTTGTIAPIGATIASAASSFMRLRRAGSTGARASRSGASSAEMVSQETLPQSWPAATTPTAASAGVANAVPQLCRVPSRTSGMR